MEKILHRDEVMENFLSQLEVDNLSLETLETLEEKIHDKLEKLPEPFMILPRILRRYLNRLIIKNSIPKEIIEPILREFELINDFVTSPDGVKSGFSTVIGFLNDHKNTHINSEYQRHMELLNGVIENKWTSTSGYEFMVSLLNDSHQTTFSFVDYKSCRDYCIKMYPEHPEYSEYFDKLINDGYNFGIIDGGHRYLLLTQLLNDILSGKEEKLLLKLISERNVDRSILLEQIKNSIIYYHVNTKLTPDKIHVLFSMLNCGVPVSKDDLLNTRISVLNTHIKKMKNLEHIQRVLDMVHKKNKTLNFPVLYHTYFLESYDHDIKSLTDKELEDFILKIQVDPILSKKHSYIFEIIDKLFLAYFTEYDRFIVSTAQIMSLYFLLSIIYDDKKIINSQKYSLFMKIFLKWFGEINNTKQIGKQKDDNWHTRLRDVKRYFDEKWKLFSNLYEDKAFEDSHWTFPNISDNKLSIKEFLIDDDSIELVKIEKLHKQIKVKVKKSQKPVKLTKLDLICKEYMEEGKSKQEICNLMGVKPQSVEIRMRRIKKSYRNN